MRFLKSAGRNRVASVSPEAPLCRENDPAEVGESDPETSDSDSHVDQTSLANEPPPTSARRRGPPPDYTAVAKEMAEEMDDVGSDAATGEEVPSQPSAHIDSAEHREPPSTAEADANSFGGCSDASGDGAEFLLVGGISEATAATMSRRFSIASTKDEEEDGHIVGDSGTESATSPVTADGDKRRSAGLKVIPEGPTNGQTQNSTPSSGVSSGRSTRPPSSGAVSQTREDIMERNRAARQISRRKSLTTMVDSWMELFGGTVSDGSTGGLFARPGVPTNTAIGYNFVLDAMEGRLKNGRGSLFFSPKWKQLCFVVNVDNRWQFILMAATALYLLITAWEPIGTSTGPSWTLAVEGFIIFLFTTDVLLKVAYVGWKSYRNKKQHQLVIAFVALYIVDFLLHLMFRGTEKYIRFSRPLRPAFILVRNRELRRTLFGLVRMGSDLSFLFAGLAAYILFFAILGVQLFSEQYQSYTPPPGAEDYPIPGAFDNVAIAFLRLYVLFSTENYPEIALPAFEHNRGSISFFVVYIYFGVFFLQSLLLAIIVAIYLDRAGKAVTSERKKEWKTLVTAFKLLDQDGKGYIDTETWGHLMYTLQPYATIDEVRFKFDLLDREKKGHIDCVDFLDLREITQLQLHVVHDYKRSLNPEHHAFVRLAQRVNSNEYTPYVSNGLILINTVMAATVYRQRSSAETQHILTVNVVLYGFMVVDTVIRLIAEGRKEYAANLYHVVDMIVLTISGPLLIVALCGVKSGILGTIANLLLFCRLAWNLAAGRMLLLMLQRVGPPMLYMSVLVTCALYFFAVIGFESFHGRRPAAPEDAYFYEYGGCNLGFETFGCSVLALFQMMTTSNWHEIMNSAIAVFGPAAAVYFCAFYLIVNLILMNLMAAVTIEAFLSARKDVKKTIKFKKDNKEALITFSTTAESAGFNLGGQDTISSSGQSCCDEPDQPVRRGSFRRFLRRRSSLSNSSRSITAASLRWKTAARLVNNNLKNVAPVETKGDRIYKVFRRPGSWRRELIPNHGDALTALDEADLKALSKAANKNVHDIAERKKNSRNEPSMNQSLVSDSGSKMLMSKDALKHVSPILRRFSTVNIANKSVDILDEDQLQAMLQRQSSGDLAQTRRRRSYSLSGALPRSFSSFMKPPRKRSDDSTSDLNRRRSSSDVSAMAAARTRAMAMNRPSRFASDIDTVDEVDETPTRPSSANGLENASASRTVSTHHESRPQSGNPLRRVPAHLDLAVQPTQEASPLPSPGTSRSRKFSKAFRSAPKSPKSPKTTSMFEVTLAAVHTAKLKRTIDLHETTHGGFDTEDDDSSPHTRVVSRPASRPLSASAKKINSSGVPPNELAAAIERHAQERANLPDRSLTTEAVITAYNNLPTHQPEVAQHAKRSSAPASLTNESKA